MLKEHRLLSIFHYSNIKICQPICLIHWFEKRVKMTSNDLQMTFNDLQMTLRPKKCYHWLRREKCLKNGPTLEVETAVAKK